MPKPVIVFDVNETLLDLRALKPQFERVFGDGDVLYRWFGQVLQSALLTVVTGPYSDFGKLLAAPHGMVAARDGIALTDADARAILGAMRTSAAPRCAAGDSAAQGRRLPPGGADQLAPDALYAQLTNSGIAPFLDKILSVDAVHRLKPAAEVYRHAADSFGVAPVEARLAAAHAWDVAGAMRAGCKAAFIARPGMVRPAVRAALHRRSGSGAVAERIIALDTRSASVTVALH